MARDSLGYVAVFGPYVFSSLGTSRTFFRLRASEELVERLVQQERREFLDEYVVVAAVAAVRRPSVVIAPEPTAGGFPEAELQPGAADYFVATGRLIDVEIIAR